MENKLSIQKRTFNLSDSVTDNNDNTFDISFSSEEPVLREFGLEILSHEKGSMNMERAKSGLPLLWNHNTDNLIGRAEKIKLDPVSKKGRTTIRFSSSDFAQQVLRDIKDGIAGDVSFAYSIDEYKIDKSATRNEPDTFIVTKFTPLEISIVSIPADATVGIGRAKDITEKAADPVCSKCDDPECLGCEDTKESEPAENNVEIQVNVTIVNTESETYDKENEETIDSAEVVPSKNSKSAELKLDSQQITFQKENKKMSNERNETIALTAFAEKVGLLKEAKEMLASERSLEEVGKELMSIVSARQSQINTNGGNSFEAQDVKSYSLSRALGAKLTGDWSKAGLEKEVSDELARKLGKTTEGFFAPTSMRNTPANTVGTGLNSATSNAGASLVFNQYLGFIEMLRAKARVMELGATSLTISGGTGSFVRQNAAATGYWVGEAPASAVTASVPGFELVSFVPRTFGAGVAFSRQMLLNSPEAADALLYNDLAKVHALGLDKAAIQGTGTLQPVGLGSTSGVGAGNATTNITPTWALVNALKGLVDAAGGDLTNCAYLTTPSLLTSLETIQKGTSLAMIVEGGKIGPYKILSSTNVPTFNAAVDSQIWFGDWSNLLVANFGAMEFIVDPYTQAGQGIVNIVSSQIVDVAVKTPGSFAKAILKG